MRIISWNINGLRAFLRTTPLKKIFEDLKADVFCFQETKLGGGDIDSAIQHVDGYESVFSHSKVKKGYCGVATYVKSGQLLDAQEWAGDVEGGRALMTDHGFFVLFNVYFPNGGGGPERLEYKMNFYRSFQAHMDSLVAQNKNVILVGDVNTCHTELDLYNPVDACKRSGFLPEEREWVDSLINDSHFVDTFRTFHEDESRCYTWWDVKSAKRPLNLGWRLDYVFVSQPFMPSVTNAEILVDVHGSDHCPVSVTLKEQPPLPPHAPPALSSAAARKKQPTISSFFKKKTAPVERKEGKEEGERRSRVREEV